MTKYKLLYIFIILVCLLLPDKVIASGKHALKLDTASLEQIKIPEKTLEKFRNDSHFAYTTVHFSFNWFEKLKMKIKSRINIQFVSLSIRNIIYAILIIAFVILMVVLFRSKFQGVFMKTIDDSDFHYNRSEIEDNIAFETLLAEALKMKNFNLATRYLYLMLLRLLNQKKLIEYKLGKTNFEYLMEISNKDILPQLRSATLNYEYAWYGQFPLDEKSYHDIASEFTSLMAKIDG